MHSWSSGSVTFELTGDGRLTLALLSELGLPGRIYLVERCWNRRYRWPQIHVVNTNDEAPSNSQWKSGFFEVVH